MSERAAVLVDGIKKRFGSVTALDGVSFEVRRGTVLGLLGPNGAGKTTAVRILTTLLQPDEGRAEVEGFNVVTQTDDIRKRIGLAGQNAAVDENLTGRENIELVGRLYHLPKVEAKRRAQHLLERFDLLDAADRTVRTYSGGMRRRLDLGASLVGEPTVLFLDEPTTGSRPAQSHRPVGDHPPAGLGGNDGVAHDPISRRGRRARQPCRRHRSRPGHRRRHPRRAEVAGGRRCPRGDRGRAGNGTPRRRAGRPGVRGRGQRGRRSRPRPAR